MTLNSEDKRIEMGREIVYCSSNITYYVNQSILESKAVRFTTLEFVILGQ